MSAGYPPDPAPGPLSRGLDRVRELSRRREMRTRRRKVPEVPGTGGNRQEPLDTSNGSDDDVGMEPDSVLDHGPPDTPWMAYERKHDGLAEYERASWLCGCELTRSTDLETRLVFHQTALPCERHIK